MASPYSVCIRFSALTFRFLFPQMLSLPAEFQDLRCEDCVPDESIEIRLLTEPLQIHSDPVHVRAGQSIYRTKEGWLRIYNPLTAGDGCQVACLLCPDGNHILYYPASRWDYFSKSLRCMHLICGESLLIRHRAFLLHSSVVQHRGKAVLFFGSSGAGKSTQARLWAEHLGADIINGDRCVIMERDGIFYGGGSPWCGTSGIHRKEQYPIAGIFFLHQAEENSIHPLLRDALPALMPQITVNSWDGNFMNTLMDLLIAMLGQVPIYHLNCRADRDAVNLACSALFGKEDFL